MKLIYAGKLNNNKQQFEVFHLSLSDLNKILALQELVIQSLGNKDTLQPLFFEEFQYILEGKGLMIGAFVEDDLIAFRALMEPPLDQEHLGWDFGLVEEELDSVIYQEISGVHPDYRGNRLQQTLAILIMQELAMYNKRYAYICCTVAPFNIPSLKDKFAQGMEIVALKEKYGGLLRYIFVKEIAEGGNRYWTEIETIRMDDTISQQAVLSRGFHGFQMENQDGENWVIYGKR